MSKKVDGVIEAVRYSPGGQIEFVRAYERRGAAFSDRTLLKRDALLERLKAGKRFVTGRRVELLAGTFETGPAVVCTRAGGNDTIVTAGQAAGRDHLEGVPVL
jgi:hypothetical protein